MGNLWYSLLGGIKSLVFWLPVIWQDRHWDQAFIWVLLKRKLQGVEKVLAEGPHLDGAAQAKRVHVAILVLDRLIETKQFDIVYHDVDWNRRVNDPVPYDVRKKHEWEEYLIKQDIEYLFDIMRRYIRNWWT